jgi:hypothetical protein
MKVPVGGAATFPAVTVKLIVPSIYESALAAGTQTATNSIVRTIHKDFLITEMPLNSLLTPGPTSPW